MAELVEESTGIDFWRFSEDQLEEAKRCASDCLREKRVATPTALAGVAAASSVGHVLNTVFEECVESSLVQPEEAAYPPEFTEAGSHIVF